MDEQKEFLNFKREILEHFLALKEFRHQESELRRIEEVETMSPVRNPIDRFLYCFGLFFSKKSISLSKVKRAEALKLLAIAHLRVQICSLVLSNEFQEDKEELIVDAVARTVWDPGCRKEFSIPMDFELFGACCDELCVQDIGKYCSGVDQ